MIIKEDINEYTVEELISIKDEASKAANVAAAKHIEEHGEYAYCGFAWVDIYGVKGSTKLGRKMKEAGFVKNYSGDYSIWNPSGSHTQCMTTKEIGAKAAAEVFQKAGFISYSHSRAD
jgi:hypothetical protein